MNNKNIKLSEIQKKINAGYISKDCELTVFDKIDNLSINKSVVFIGKRKFLNTLNNELISGVICSEDLRKDIESNFNLGIWITENPKDLFYIAHNYLVSNNYYQKPFENKISKSAYISSRAIISDNSIEIGDNTIIEDHVILKPFTKIGKDTIVRSNSDIGSDGFEATTVNGILRIIRHGGEIIIGDNVEIQSLNTISRGLFPSRNSVIKNNVKIADMVHIAHGVHIGDNTLIAAGVTISGNTTIGKNVWIGPGAILSNRLFIGDYANISIGCVVARNVKSNEKVTGFLGIDHNKYLKFLVEQKLM